MLKHLVPYSAVLICAVTAIIVFVVTVGQTSQSAYQEGLRAGKASAQTAAYDQGYSRGYASAIYEVGA